MPKNAGGKRGSAADEIELKFMKVLKSFERSLGLTVELDEHEVLSLLASLMLARTALGEGPEGLFAERLGRSMMTAAMGSEQAMLMAWVEMSAKYDEVITARFKMGGN